jgi:hypothetical protein
MRRCLLLAIIVLSVGCFERTGPTKVAPPDLTCSRITVTAQTGESGAVVTFPLPTPHPPAKSVACTPASGSTFPVGTTQVTCTASGYSPPFSGITMSCVFPVIVN